MRSERCGRLLEDDRIHAKAHAAVFAAVLPGPFDRAHGAAFGMQFGAGLRDLSSVDSDPDVRGLK